MSNAEPPPSSSSPLRRAGTETAPDPEQVAARLRLEVARLGVRLAKLVGGLDPGMAGAGMEAGAQFLADAWTRAQPRDEDPGPLSSAHPLGRVCRALHLSPCEVDLVLLAGMAEEHEGYASVLQGLHPRNEPVPTVGLAARLLCPDSEQRTMLRALLESGPAVRRGLLQLSGDGPFFNQGLSLPPRLWSILTGIDCWPPGADPIDRPARLWGLEEWLEVPTVARARAMVRASGDCIIVFTAPNVRTAMARARAMVQTTGNLGACFMLPVPIDEQLVRRIGLAAVARATVPILALRPDAKPELRPPVSTPGGPLVICAERNAVELSDAQPVISIDCTKLDGPATRRAWSMFLPSMADQADALAARYPLEPALIQTIGADVRAHTDDLTPVDLDTVGRCVRARAGAIRNPGLDVRTPTASWDDLVLPAPKAAILRDAVARIRHQPRVLDDWGFLADRPGRRGVRMLLAGPPGTGKTYSAEVIAYELGTELMIIDLSRVVSKWIGETEKNLGGIFEAAEASCAVLFFDEADALLCRRTEVSDAHDRYANLETAYLLTRIEQYEGLAILATNLRKNIDPAFMRRLEFVVEYEQPGRSERVELWRRHLPPDAPQASDLGVAELARFYPMSGGMIRNAAVAAAFLAAEDGVIDRDHLLLAIRREYEKSGTAFPGTPNRRPGVQEKPHADTG
ncbi:MAG: ATP-binding protein [Deltaproteobacteria bacterium]|nr:ATP-binding protein [Deltaproteobacteria bacterium]